MLILWLVIIALLVIVLELTASRMADTRLESTHTHLEFNDLPAALHGYRIAHLSDLHGNLVPGLEGEVRAFQPDIIVCTGDMFDGVQGKENTIEVLGNMLLIAPVYMVTGNHEMYMKDWPKYRQIIKNMGVHLLENEEIRIHANGQEFSLTGIKDPLQDIEEEPLQTAVEAMLELKDFQAPNDAFSIVLYHRANLFDLFDGKGYDLVLSGHLHGGQWRFFNRGVAGPGTFKRVDLFPKYDAGLFRHGKTQMYVSRGLGDQIKFPRINNRPEVVLITLESSMINRLN